MSISTEFASILMPNAGDEAVPVVTVESEWFRLIPSRFPPVSLYSRVIANDRTDELAEVENLTNPRLRAAKTLTNGIEPIDPTSSRLQNWNLAPFTYPNPHGTHFFRMGHSCLELAADIQTALAISVARREAFLRRTNEAPIGLDMRVLKTPVNGKFVDLRGRSESFTGDQRWEIGDKIIKAGHDGVLFCSPQRPCGSCIGIVKDSALGRTQQTRHYRYLWDGSRISTLYAFDDAREISADTLTGSESIVAA